MVTQTINLNMVPGSVYPVVHVNQFDNDAGALIFKLYNGAAFSIPSSSAVVINGTKPDGYGFTYSASYSGNTVTADLTEQMTAVAGEVKCELRITKGTDVVGTQNFTLMVEPAALDSGTVVSDSDIPAIAAASTYASEAAASAAEAAATVSGKVSKTGDTMTGDLYMSEGEYYISQTTLTKGTTPSSNQYRNGVLFRDTEGSNLAQLRSFYLTDGTWGAFLEAVGSVNNYFRLGVKGSTPVVLMSHPSAWRDPLMTPTRVDSGSIDDITTPGYYYLVQNSVSDLPEGINGQLLVFHSLGDGSENAVIQIYRRGGTAGTNDQNFYIRQKQSSGWGQWWKYGDSTQYLNVSNSVSVSGINCSGLITSTQKNMAFFVPYPVVGTSFTINNLSVITRYPDFTSGGGIYPYVRSGTNGSTYTQLGYTNTSLYTNGAATRSNEIDSVSISVQPGAGIQFSIAFVYAICRASGNTTAVENNLPATIQVTLTGTSS